MITNFDGVTEPLSDDEKKLIPILIRGFKLHGKDNPITGAEIVKSLNDKKDIFGIKNFSDSRLRKITNYIRSEGMLPIIATSKGYYVSYDKEEIQNQIKSLQERADAILNSANGLKIYLKSE